ncbi:MAG: HEAT repeat domain-containing protein [Gemmataceae bacterium]
MNIRGTPELWIEWLAGSDRRKWKEATLILGGLSPDDQIPLEPLIKGLSSADDNIVFWCAIGLGCTGPKAINAVNELIRVADGHNQVGARQAAINALSDVAPNNNSVKLTVLGCLNDASPFVRREALEALIECDKLTDDDLSKIAAMQSDPDNTVAEWSEIALRNIKNRREGTTGT